jgi:hypothetical protein
MSDAHAPLISHSQPSRKVFIDPAPEFFIFLELVIRFSERTATGTTEGTDRESLLLGKGQISRCHKEIGVVVEGFDGIAAAAEFRDILKLDAQPLSHFPGRDLVIEGSYRNRASEVEDILRKGRVPLRPFHDEVRFFLR